MVIWLGHSEGAGVKTGLHTPPEHEIQALVITWGGPPPLNLALATFTDKIMTPHIGYVYSASACYAPRQLRQKVFQWLPYGSSVADIFRGVR